MNRPGAERTLLFHLLDAELSYYLARALRKEIDWAERVGQKLPGYVLELHEACRTTVIDSPARTRNEMAPVPVHSENETPALLVTYAEAARRLALSKRTVGRMIASGELDTVLVGKSKRIATAEILSLIHI